VKAAKAQAAPICTDKGRVAVAGMLGISQGSVSPSAAVGNNGEPECHFTADVGNRRIRVVVNVDTSPQPYARLERTIVEDGQQFGLVRGFAAPVTVPKLGLDAAWVPDADQVITTDGNALITATVAWGGARQAQRRALATAAARAYLGKLNRKAAQQTEV